LVVRLSLSVTGAGIAMLARETVTLCVLLIFLLRGKSLIRPTLRSFSLRKDVFFGIMRFGLPTLLRQGLMSLSSILLTRAASGFGAAVLAGSGLTVRVCALVSSAMIGFGQGFQPVCGAASGAGNTQRIKKAYSFCMLCMLIASVFVGISVFFFSDFLLSPFAPDKETALFAAAGLRAQSVTFFAMGAVIMMNMLTQAMGLTIRASLIATSRQGFLFIPLIMLLPRLWGAAGLVICQSISDLLSLALCFFITKKGITGSSSARGGCSDARTAFQSDRHS